MLKYPTFYILRSSSIVGLLHLNYLNNLLWSPKSKFKNLVGSNKQLQRYFTFNIWRSSSIGGHLLLKDLQNMVWSYKLKFKIWVWSNCWDIPLLIFWGGLPLAVVCILRIYKIWFGHIILSFKFEYDQISICWDIPL